MPPLCLSTLVFDLLLGEPPNRFHPTVWMGRFVSFLEAGLYAKEPPSLARFRGALLVFLAVAAAALAGASLQVASLVLLPFPFDFLVVAALGSLAIACRSLASHALPVLRALCSFKLGEARKRVSLIVGRDTAELGRGEVSRAGVEAVAESLGDGVAAPLFWLAVLGLPGVFAYRISNTMDSMLGHKDERYSSFGWAAARFDDLLNVIPAWLLAAPAIALAALFAKGLPSARSAVSAAWRCHAAHKSPSAGWYEAAFAGALGVRLGGANRYCGELCEYPLMNSEGRAPRPRDLRDAVRIMLLATVFSAAALDVLATVAWTLLQRIL